MTTPAYISASFGERGDEDPLESRRAAFIVWSPDSPEPPRFQFTGPQARRVAERMAEAHPGQRFYAAHLVACAGGPSMVPAVRLASLVAAWRPFAACVATVGTLQAAANYVRDLKIAP